MLAKRILPALILLASACGLAGADNTLGASVVGALQGRAEAAGLKPAGSYVRRHWMVPLYRVSLETADAREIALRWRQNQQRSRREKEGPSWSALAAFLLDPQNHVPVRLTLQILTGVKDYTDESRTIREGLARMGLPLDARWSLQGRRELQGEVTRLAEAVIGLSADRPGLYYRNRRRGDVYIFFLDGQGRASLTYLPAAENAGARAGRTEFQDPRVVAAFVGACLLPGPGDEGASSAALLQGIREACQRLARR